MEEREKKSLPDGFEIVSYVAFFQSCSAIVQTAKPIPGVLQSAPQAIRILEVDFDPWAIPLLARIEQEEC
jgi:hypothetical protein